MPDNSPRDDVGNPNDRSRNETAMERWADANQEVAKSGPSQRKDVENFIYRTRIEVPMGSEARTPLEQLVYGFGKIMERLFRRKLLYLTIFAITSGLLLGAIAFKTPLYSSTALLLVKSGRELVYRPEISGDRSVVNHNKKNFINSELVIARSQPVLESVVAGIGVDKLYPTLSKPKTDDSGLWADLLDRLTMKAAHAIVWATSLPKLSTESSEEPTVLSPEKMQSEAVFRLRDSLTITALPESDVLRFTFPHPDPQVAADTVNMLVKSFIEKHVQAFGDTDSLVFLEQQVQSYKAMLDGAEERLRDFEKRHEAFALENPKIGLAERQKELRLAIRQVDQQLTSLIVSQQNDGAIADAKSELLALRTAGEHYRGRIKQQNDEKIEIISEFLAERAADIRSQTALQEQRRNELQAQLESIEQKSSELPHLAAEYRALLRERDVNAEQYSTYLQRLRDAQLSDEMDQKGMSSISVIQPGYPAPRPVSAGNKSFQAAVAVLLALIVAGMVTSLVDVASSYVRRRGSMGPAKSDPSSSRKLVT